MSTTTTAPQVPKTYCGLPVYRLADVLKMVPLPPNCPLSGVSRKWRCVLAPKVDSRAAGVGESDGDESAAALRYFEAGIPCRLARERAAPAHAACGPDAFAFIYDARWSQFPRPKIAFKAGWAGPGTAMESEAYHKLIRSFREVLEHKDGVQVDGGASGAAEDNTTNPAPAGGIGDAAAATKTDALPAATEEDADFVKPEEILNLQMFHRSDPNVDPLIPVLSEKMTWLDVLHEGAVCDNATRVSQRGAITWWHLDDSGEFVMQTGLPLLAQQRRTASSSPTDDAAGAATQPWCYGAQPTNALESSIYNTLYCVDENGPASIPTKLFVYGPPNSYDWFAHDDEADASGKVAALDIFRCSDDDLPVDDALLPILTVAVLESGGRPLISPPNIPHAVITVNDCVMVEQRRVCNLFLEEVAYFVQKCKTWSGHPIVYQYVEEQLQNEAVLRDEVIPTLLALFEAYDNDGAPLDVLVRKRVAAALYTIHRFPDVFKLPDDSRRSLQLLIEDKMERYLSMQHEGELQSRKQAGVSPWTLKRRLEDHWEVKEKYWPKPGCVFAPPRNASSPYPVNPVPQRFLPVVYRRGMPVFGCEKSSVDATAKEYHHMVKLRDLDAAAAGGAGAATVPTSALAKYLSSVKCPVKDDLLDELF